MKNISLKLSLTCGLMICLLSQAKAQTPVLSFEYDEAGNQIKREWICVNCPDYSTPVYTLVSKYMASSTVTPPSTNKIADRKLTAFPNPLREQLTLKWDNTNYYIKAIEVSTIAGASVFNQCYNYTEGVTEITVPFNKQIPGLYFIRVLYSDGKQDLVRVVKNGN